MRKTFLILRPQTPIPLEITTSLEDTEYLRQIMARTFPRRLSVQPHA